MTGIEGSGISDGRIGGAVTSVSVVKAADTSRATDVVSLDDSNLIFNDVADGASHTTRMIRD